MGFQGNMVNRSFSTKELLSPLSGTEQDIFKNCLNKLRDSSEGVIDITALSIFIVDVLHDSHKDELSTSLSILVNKLVQEPFIGDRNLLKEVLETIMKGIYSVESIND